MKSKIGIFIKNARIKKGLSQAFVAKELKLKTAQSLSNIERGVSPLPKKKIKQLSTVLDVNKKQVVNLILSDIKTKYLKAAGL